MPRASPHPVCGRYQTNKLFVTRRCPGRFLPTVTEISTGTGPTNIIHNIASKQDGLRAPQSAPLPENMPRGPLAPCAPSTSGAPSGRERARALHGRAPDGSHERLPMSTSMCAMFSDSKMRPRIVLRQREHKVSIGQALSACDKMATVWPHAARCGGFEVPCVLRGWCGLCGAGGAALRGPYSILHFYTYRLTCASLIAFTRRSDTPTASRGALCPPRSRWDSSSKEPARPAAAGDDLIPGCASAGRGWQGRL